MKVGLLASAFQVDNSFWTNATDEEKEAWRVCKKSMLEWLYSDDDEKSVENRIRESIASQRETIIENMDHALYGFVELIRKEAWDKVDPSLLVDHYCIQIPALRDIDVPEFEACTE